MDGHSGKAHELWQLYRNCYMFLVVKVEFVMGVQIGG